MKPTLKADLTHRFVYTVPVSKTVPYLYEESPELAVMPEVLATGFMVGLMEWTCVELLAPHLDPGEGSLGVHIDVSHKAAAPVDFTITVEAECIEVRGPRAKFVLRAHDGVDEIRSRMSDSSSIGTASTSPSLARPRRSTPRWTRDG
jgi:fluoroacetyl-CoA thioesterase